MAADFENMGYEAVTKTISRIKMAAESDLRVPEAVRPITEIKMVANFENMGYEAVAKNVSRIKWPPNPIKGSPKP